MGIIHSDIFLCKTLLTANLAIRTRLVDTFTIPTLIQLSNKGIIDPAVLLTHRECSSSFFFFFFFGGDERANWKFI